MTVEPCSANTFILFPPERCICGEKIYSLYGAFVKFWRMDWGCTSQRARADNKIWFLRLSNWPDLASLNQMLISFWLLSCYRSDWRRSGPWWVVFFLPCRGMHRIFSKNEIAWLPDVFSRHVRMNKWHRSHTLTPELILVFLSHNLLCSHGPKYWHLLWLQNQLLNRSSNGLNRYSTVSWRHWD